MFAAISIATIFTFNMITMPEFTEEQKKDNLRLAIKALRENPKKAKNLMMDDEGGRCCLCVMAHVAEDICGAERNSFCGSKTPKIDLNKFFYVNNVTFSGDNFLLKTQYASVWNDGSNGIKEKSHAEIADMIEKEYLS
jgi:hypothetical protein